MKKTEIPPGVKQYMSSLGKRSLQTMTPEQRKERARKAVQKRWSLSTETSHEENKDVL